MAARQTITNNKRVTDGWELMASASDLVVTSVDL